NDKVKNNLNTFNESLVIDRDLEEATESEGENREDNFVVDNNYFPSTMGLTFYCDAKQNFQVNYKIETAIYKKVKHPFLSINEIQIQQINEFMKLNEKNKNNVQAIVDINTENKTIQFKDEDK